MRYKKNEDKKYENVFEGLSYYPTVGETYHLNRSKTKVQKFYLEAIEGIDQPKILDIGCYIGTDLFMLPKVNPKDKYWGVDISFDAISFAKRFAKKRGEKNINFLTADANEKLPFSDKFFDVVLALEVIEHLKNPEKFMLEINRILRSKGVAIISTPNEERFLNRLIEKMPNNLKKAFLVAREKDFARHGNAFYFDSQTWDHEAHISVFGFGKWKKIFNQAGFKIEQIEGSSIFGGSRVIGDRAWLLGLTILIDSIIDKIPIIKPHLQMCIIVKLQKNVE